MSCVVSAFARGSARPLPLTVVALPATAREDFQFGMTARRGRIGIAESPCGIAVARRADELRCESRRR
jgi:hypothetical protein